MKRTNFLCFDLETGGFDYETKAITEGAFILYDGVTLEEMGRYQDLVHPYADLEYDQEAFDATGIDFEMISKQGVPIQKFVKNIIKLCQQGYEGPKTGKWRRPVVLVGHNIDDFDIPFLSLAFEIVGQNILDYVSEDTEDTLKICRKKWMAKDMKFSLTACCEEAGIEIIDAHRAMNDVEANIKLHKFLIRCLRSESMAQEEEQEQYRATFQF